MDERYEVQRITHLPRQILTLEKEAIGEGFRFLTRLINEWHSGANRFDAPGECLMAAYLNQQLIGIGGLQLIPMLTIMWPDCDGCTSQLRQGGNTSGRRW